MPSRSGTDPGSIEFLPPDVRAFGGAAHDGPGSGGSRSGGFVEPPGFEGFDEFDGFDEDEDERPASQWGTVAAVLAAVALLIAGVVVAKPWTDDAAPTATPPTTAPDTTMRVATPDATDLDAAGIVSNLDGTAWGGRVATGAGGSFDAQAGGWLLDPPLAGLRLHELVDGAGSVVGEPTGWGEVWATPDATRTAGRWFSVTLLPFASLPPVGVGWFAVDVAGRPGRAAVAADGVVRLVVERSEVDASRLVRLDGSGLSLTELVELADSLAIDDDRPQLADDRPRFVRPELLDGLTRIASGTTGSDLVDDVVLGRPFTSSAVYTGPGRDDVTVVHARAAGGVPDALAALAVSPGDAAFDVASAFEGFRPTDVLVGERPVDGADVQVVRWRTGDDEVWLLTTLSAGVLPAMLDDVRRVAPADWTAARDRAATTDGFTADLGRADPATVAGQGWLLDATPWSLVVFPATDRAELLIGGSTVASTLSGVLGTDRAATVGVFASGSTTFVLGASSVEGASLRLRRADGSDLAVALDAIAAGDEPPTEPGRLDGSFWASWEGTRMVALAFEPPPGDPAFVAEIVAPDGAVIAAFDPWAIGAPR